MSIHTAVALLLYFLVVNQSAWSSQPAVNQSAVREAAERVNALVEKILRDIPAAHTAAVNTEGLTLDPSSSQTVNLQTMMSSLGIPPPPVLKPPTLHFTLDLCVSRMAAGGRLYQSLLGVLSEKRVNGLTDIETDLRDLLTHIAKMGAAVGVNTELDVTAGLDLASRLHGNYEVQVATHLTLTQLRSFCHDLVRTLRAVDHYRL